jgi:hypothetical protein
MERKTVTEKIAENMEVPDLQDGGGKSSKKLEFPDFSQV